MNNYVSGRTILCVADIELIENWRFDLNITLENEQFLTVSGLNELRQLAERYQSVFPTLLSSIYSRNDYFFRPAATQRLPNEL